MNNPDRSGQWMPFLNVTETKADKSQSWAWIHVIGQIETIMRNVKNEH